MANEANTAFDAFVASLLEVNEARELWHAVSQDPQRSELDKKAYRALCMETECMHARRYPDDGNRSFEAGAEHGLLPKGYVNDERNVAAKAAHKKFIFDYVKLACKVADRAVQTYGLDNNDDDKSVQRHYALLLDDGYTHYILTIYDAWNIGCSEAGLMGSEAAKAALKQRMLFEMLRNAA